MKSIFIPVAFLLLSFLLTESRATAQNALKDYVTDRFAAYQPTDALERGLMYRIQTGHAGAFANRDNDLSKLCSPYIQWSCRQPRMPKPVLNILGDVGRKRQRFRDGISLAQP